MIREIHIKAVLNGFVVNVGCQSVVFESVDRMLGELKIYLNDPQPTEKVWLEKAINSKHTYKDGGTVCTAPEPMRVDCAGSVPCTTPPSRY